MMVLSTYSGSLQHEQLVSHDLSLNEAEKLTMVEIRNLFINDLINTFSIDSKQAFFEIAMNSTLSSVSSTNSSTFQQWWSIFEADNFQNHRYFEFTNTIKAVRVGLILCLKVVFYHLAKFVHRI